MDRTEVPLFSDCQRCTVDLGAWSGLLWVVDVGKERGGVGLEGLGFAAVQIGMGPGLERVKGWRRFVVQVVIAMLQLGFAVLVHCGCTDAMLMLQIGITSRIGTPSAVVFAFRAVMQDESTEVSW